MTNSASTDENSFTVTPYTVSGEIDYEKPLEQFGADRLTEEQIARFPEPRHPLVRRRVFYAGRDVDQFLQAATAGDIAVKQRTMSTSPVRWSRSSS